MIKKILLSWFDNQIKENEYTKRKFIDNEIDWYRVIPFILIHLACFFVFYVGYSHVALFCFILLYVIRMFAITGFYHRYFSHKTFKTSRVMQFIFAILGASAGQRGPLWWAAHHRKHHIHSDQEHDLHSPHINSFFWSHTGWFLSKKNFLTDHKMVRELNTFKELKIIDRFDILIPILLMLFLYFLGGVLSAKAPHLNTNGAQLLVWGFVLSTVLLYHATFLINSASHVWGKRRYNTDDRSKNNWLLALITFGEGWHNNHHHHCGSVKQGFYWWEIDITYYLLRALSWLGVIWDLRTVSVNIRNANRIDKS